MNLTEFSIKKPFFIFVFWLFIVFFGIQSFYHLPISFGAKNNFVQVSITTVYPGGSKEKILSHITKVLEREIFLINKDIDVYSNTENESSEITVKFKKEIPEAEAMSILFLAVNRASEDFPKGTSTPIIKALGSYNSPLLTIAVTSNLPSQNLYDIVEKHIKPGLEEIRDVSYISIIDRVEKQATIQLNLDKMKEREISASDIQSRLKEMGKNIVFGENANTFLMGEFTSLDDIRSFTIQFLDNDRGVVLGDLAEVFEEVAQPANYTFYNGVPCLFLEIYARKHANEWNLEKAIPIKIKELKKRFSSQNLSFITLANKEPNIISLMNDFTKNIWIAIAAAFLIIWIVFVDINSIVVSITSIPLSLCGAFCVLYLGGYSFNLYTILAFIVATGLIIDDIIIIREDIYRHLELGLSPFAATRKAMKEMMHPITGTTCMILAVALSMIIVQKTASTQYLTSFGMTLFACMFFSYLEALTLGPLLCAYCLRPKKNQTPEKSIFQEFAEKILDIVHKYTRTIVLGALVLLAVGYISSLYIRTEAMPLVEVGNLVIHKTLPPLSFEESKEKALAFAQEIRHEFPDVENIGLKVNKDEQIFYLHMVPKDVRTLSAKELKFEIQENLEKQRISGEIRNYKVSNNVIPNPSDFFDYSLEITSYDKESLNRYGHTIFHLLQRSDELINLTDSSNKMRKERFILFNQEKMNHLGVELTPLANEMNLLLNGYEIDATYAPREKGDFSIKPKIQLKHSVNFHNLLDKASAFNMNNKLVPLNSFASTQANKPESQEIRRKNGQDLIEITGTTNPKQKKNNALDFTVNAIQTKAPLPKNIQIAWGGNSKELMIQKITAPQLIAIALFFIYMTLILLYQSIILPLIILFPLPFSVTGSLIALLITGNSVNVFSNIGITITVGIAAKNGIILLKYTNQLINEGIPYTEAIYTAVKVRLRPILMTMTGVLLTTIPILIPWSNYSKLQFSLGIAIIGGLITSTMVNIIIIPILFQHTYRFYLTLSNYVQKFFNSDTESS